ncbi:MAG TPA: phosphoribosylamine--glycine ligase [Actinomycetota bacterium]|nr:phosphoribosylamine--glycine ligase [Actinomycetota bacterium]
MKVLVVGGGGREHALAWRLRQDASVTDVLAAPGNPGIAQVARCIGVRSDDPPGLIDLARRERVDLVVIGPEAPLVAGLADSMEAAGVAVFGPSAAAARLEGSKAFAKDLMERAEVPTARSATFTRRDWQTDPRDVLSFLDELGGGSAVVKADGLAAGKGVVVAERREAAADAVEAALGRGAFGDAGASVVVEERLEGREVSAFALTDGSRVVPLAFAQDAKRVGDRDVGPNTGGMGAFSPVPFVDADTAERIRVDVFERTVEAMAADGVAYRGVLYAGLMLTEDGPKVLEYNCRFGDPETQALMPLLRTEPAALLLDCARGGLGDRSVELESLACVTVVVASGGYPADHRTGLEISGLEAAGSMDGTTVFHSGTAERRGRVVTAGGRVVSVSAVGGSLAGARDRAYEAVSHVRFEGRYHRTDIAAWAAKEEGT